MALNLAHHPPAVKRRGRRSSSGQQSRTRRLAPLVVCQAQDTDATPRFGEFGAPKTGTPTKRPAKKGPSVIRREKVIGSRRFSNYFWAVVAPIGSFAFIRNGLFGGDVFTQQQQIVQTFYGSLGVLLTLFLWGQVFWSVGDGFNEYNKTNRMVRIFRWGLPGKKRRMDIKVPFDEVSFVELGKPNEGLFLRLKGKRSIKLTSQGYLLSEAELEYRGAELAKFLQCTIKKRSKQ